MKKYLLMLVVCSVSLLASQEASGKVNMDGIEKPKESKEYMKMVNEAYQKPISRTVVKDSNESK